MEVIIITLISTAGLATISRVGMVSGINIYNYYIRKKTKIILKRKLKKSIEKCDFINFKDIIYRIKAYDNTYNKYLYIKMKRKYFFTDKTTKDIYFFNKRFNLNDNIPSPSILRSIVREEIELSLSKKND